MPSNHLFDTDEGEENHREVVFQAGLEGFADETDVVVNLVFGDIQQLGDLLVFQAFHIAEEERAAFCLRQSVEAFLEDCDDLIGEHVRQVVLLDQTVIDRVLFLVNLTGLQLFSCFPQWDTRFSSWPR